jgi:hypothetical protein
MSAFLQTTRVIVGGFLLGADKFLQIVTAMT